MNSKLCKKLRDAARAATVGMPYRKHEPNYVCTKMVNTGLLHPNTGQPIIAQVEKHVITNDYNSTRGRYRSYKRTIAADPSAVDRALAIEFSRAEQG